MTNIVRHVALVAFVAISVACDDHARPTAPSSTSPPTAAAPSPSPTLPPLTGATTTYRFSDRLSYPVRAFTAESSFVLFESGAFYLKYEAIARPYVGGYQRDGAKIIFFFTEFDSSADAIGTLSGDRLEVRFSEMMQHSDFENAVYRLSQ